VKWGNARRQPNYWGKDNGNKKEDQRKFGNGPDQWAVHGRVKPNEIVVRGLLSGVAGTVLGIEVLDTKHVISGGYVGEKGCNDECNADNVEPARFGDRDGSLTKRDADRPG
jgi:hypothetical protein